MEIATVRLLAAFIGQTVSIRKGMEMLEENMEVTGVVFCCSSRVHMWPLYCNAGLTTFK